MIGGDYVARGGAGEVEFNAAADPLCAFLHREILRLRNWRLVLLAKLQPNAVDGLCFSHNDNAKLTGSTFIIKNLSAMRHMGNTLTEMN